MPQDTESGGSDVAESAENDSASRFLKRRTKQNSESDYHPSHKKTYLAKIPECLIGESHDTDRESTVMSLPKRQVDDEDIRRLKQAAPHLPDDVILRVLFYHEYDVDAAILVAQQMHYPDLMPQFCKDIYVANIAAERDANPTRREPYKEFYFEKQLAEVVDSKTLVNFYYQEKNKIFGNWRLNNFGEEDTPEERVFLEERMKSAGISLIIRDPIAPRRGPRVSARLSTRLKDQVVQNGDSVPGTSDATSSSSATPELSSESRVNSKDPDTIVTISPPKSPQRIEGGSEAAKASTSRSTPSSPRRKTRNRRSIEQQRNGPQKTYPIRSSRD